MFKSVNPFDQSLLAEFPVMSDRDLEAKIAKAAMASRSWRTASFSQRAAVLNKVADLLKSNHKEYAKIISLEMGKVLSEAKAEVLKCAAGCAFYAEHAEAFLADQIISSEAVKSFVSYRQPLGTILGVMPWNYPFWQVFRFAAPAVMAGNAALLKHSSNVPQCGLLIEKIFQQAGLPDGVFQNMFIQSTAIEKILSHDLVHGVALTGSEKAGSSVASIAGKHIKKSVLELGGSDPFIILEDADLENAAKVATQSRMQNAGQSCIAAKRFIVVKAVKDEFVNRFSKSIAALKQGNQLSPDVTTGPMARVDLAEALEEQMNQSVKQGAQVITGGTRDGANFQPALLDRVKKGMSAFEEETFGPVAAVITVEDEHDAIEMANSSRYGLGASVWTTDRDRGEWVARRIESGSVFVNSLMRSDVRFPFGGVKKSGYGRELSSHGIREFVNAQTIYIE